MFFYTNQANQIRCSVTAITSRSHRGDRGSTPRFGVIFYSFFRDYLGSIFTTKAHEVTFSEPAPFFQGSLLFSSVIPFCKCHRIKY